MTGEERIEIAAKLLDLNQDADAAVRFLMLGMIDPGDEMLLDTTTASEDALEVAAEIADELESL